MLVAINDQNIRIRPEKGLTGFCQLCGEKVVSACGDINIHHWRHLNLKNCNSHKENETEWHRNWKNQFPFEWQEVIIIKSGIKHIADIQTNTGLIIEFQNSPISQGEIRKRESFYENMIWIINADNFKHNIQKSSLVQNMLRINGFSGEFEPEHQGFYINSEAQELQDKLSRKILDYEVEERNLYSLASEINDLEQDSYSIRELADSLVKNPFKLPYELSGRHFLELDKIKGYKTSIIRLEEIKENNNEMIDFLKSLPFSKEEKYAHLQIVNFSYKGLDKYYEDCLLVSTIEKDGLFRTERKFTSMLDFNKSKYLSEKDYTLLYNSSNKMDEHKNKINNLEQSIQDQKKLIEIERVSLWKTLKEEVLAKIVSKKSTLKEREKAFNNMFAEMSLIEIKISNSKKKESEQREAFEAKQREDLLNSEKEYKKKRWAIMKMYKGRYTYHWKWRVKSWDVSIKNRFLDFGEQLYQVLPDEELKRFSISEIMSFIKNK